MSCPPRGPPGPSWPAYRSGVTDSGEPVVHGRAGAQATAWPDGARLAGVPPWADAPRGDRRRRVRRVCPRPGPSSASPSTSPSSTSATSTPSSRCSTKWPPPGSIRATWPTRSGPSSGGPPTSTFRFATVTGVDWERRQVTLDGAEPLPFDSLIVASGATAKFFGIPGAAEYSFPLYTLTDARNLRDHVLRRLEAGRRRPGAVAEGALTFVVVGGGPTGVEVAGALAELLDVAVRHDGFRFDRARPGSSSSTGSTGCSPRSRRRPPPTPPAPSSGRGIELQLGHMVRRSPTPRRARRRRPDPDPDGGLGRRGDRRGHRRRPPRSRPPRPTAAWWSKPTSRCPADPMPTPSATPPPCPGDRRSGRRDRDLPPAGPGGHPVRARTPPARSSTGSTVGPPSRSATRTRASWPPSAGGRPSPSSPAA